MSERVLGGSTGVVCLVGSVGTRLVLVLVLGPRSKGDVQV